MQGKGMKVARQSYEWFSSMEGKGLIERLDSLGLLKPDVASLVMILAAAVIQSVLFFAKISVTPYPVWLMFLILCFVMMMKSGRQLVEFVLFVAFCLGLTAFTYSYVATDAYAYHFPMQVLLREGWNPIWCSTIDQFDEIAGGFEFRKIHTLFLPLFNALCGALVSRSTGLLLGDAFLNYVLIFVLFRVSYRFSQTVWRCQRIPALCFGFVVVCCEVYWELGEKVFKKSVF